MYFLLLNIAIGVGSYYFSIRSCLAFRNATLTQGQVIGYRLVPQRWISIPTGWNKRFLPVIECKDVSGQPLNIVLPMSLCLPGGHKVKIFLYSQGKNKKIIEWWKLGCIICMLILSAFSYVTLTAALCLLLFPLIDVFLLGTWQALGFRKRQEHDGLATEQQQIILADKDRIFSYEEIRGMQHERRNIFIYTLVGLGPLLILLCLSLIFIYEVCFK